MTPIYRAHRAVVFAIAQLSCSQYSLMLGYTEAGINHAANDEVTVREYSMHTQTDSNALL